MTTAHQAFQQRGRIRISAWVTHEIAAKIDVAARRDRVSSSMLISQMLTRETTAIELFAAGVAADKIAALQRKTKKQVLGEVGDAVDAEARKMLDDN